ncbi:hypothetical protein HPB47_004607 [Ixodes persulcatus]|uniref:Uncharacterized protein n=1 Tax=Ixodes persulcatus TaxID=34615 RepID=A0AC60PF79_IXOPE|nr:hypothetical protein HPB47_004607 [Ixodes persulcatus]
MNSRLKDPNSMISTMAPAWLVIIVVVTWSFSLPASAFVEARQRLLYWLVTWVGQEKVSKIRLKSVIVCSQNSGSASSVERFRPRRNSLVDFGRSPPKVESSAPLRILRVLGPACPVWSASLTGDLAFDDDAVSRDTLALKFGTVRILFEVRI